MTLTPNTTEVSPRGGAWAKSSFAAFVLAAVAILVVAGLNRYQAEVILDSERAGLVQRLILTSRLAAGLVTSEELDNYRESWDIERLEYQELKERLADLVKKAGVKYVYYFRVVNGLVQYIVDNDYEPQTRVGLETAPVDPRVERGHEKALAGQVSIDGTIEYGLGWPDLLSVYAPIFNKEGQVVAVAGADLPETNIKAARLQANLTLALEVLATLAILIYGFYARRRSALEIEWALRVDKAKNLFVARVSHEIRAPMNAIVGLSELLGRQAQTLPAQANNYIINIRRAGSSLLAIVNDVLDFARIESGNFEIVPDRYSLFSLVDDAIGVVKVRLLEKPVRLTVFLDSHSPKSLRGDAARIRQILLNLLVNAVKYTKEGSISLSVVARPRPGAVPPGSGAAGEGEGGQAVLEMKVADTGVGVRPEDLSRLFGDFERVDAEENRGVEGTGLGLAIARNLARLMGGDITATSERGRGTTFVVTLTQTIEDLSPVAQVENAAEKSVLVFERRAIYAKSLAENLDDFGVRHQVVNNYPDFYAALDKFEMTHMIMPVSVFIGLQNSLKERNVTAPLGLTTEDIHPFGLDNARYLNTPVYGRPLAAFLNNVSESPEKRDKGLVGPSFVAPEAQVLVVDDLPTDLMVAEGLFYPYGFKIELCRSGEEAIRKAKAGDYDMIFIDHLMPGMDGVEAAREIRDISEKYKNIPIVAMTANAAAEARETFLSQGLDDYLLKPIETAALNAILLRWIPLDKQEKPKKDVSLAKSGEGPGEGPGPALPNVVGLDAALGLSKANGRREAYLTTLEYFRKDALVSLTNLNASLENKEYRDFAVHAHALKSAAGVTGAVDLAARAAALEAASMARAEGFIAGNIASFRQDLLQLVDGLSRYFEALEKSGEKDLAIADEEVKRELGDLRDSLADLGEERIETALKGFLARKVGRGLRRDVEELARLYRESGVEALKAALDKTLTPTVH